MKKIGNIVYQNFGLRKEWIFEFFNNGTLFLNNSSLGPRQLQSFLIYLREIELIDKNKKLTILYDIIKEIFIKGGIDDDILWSIIWINLYFNSLLYSWYGTIERGKYSRKDILTLMANDYGKNNQVVINGFLALAGTFERTPIGKKLKIGVIKREKRGRNINKIGGYKFHPLVVLYSFYKYAEKLLDYKINIKGIEEERYSPQKILINNTKQIENSILELYKPKYLSFEENNLIIFPQRKAYDIIKLIAGG